MMIDLYHTSSQSFELQYLTCVLILKVDGDRDILDIAFNMGQIFKAAIKRSFSEFIILPIYL